MNAQYNMYIWHTAELYTWNIVDFINQCHPNNFLKINKTVALASAFHFALFSSHIDHNWACYEVHSSYFIYLSLPTLALAIKTYETGIFICLVLLPHVWAQHIGDPQYLLIELIMSQWLYLGHIRSILVRCFYFFDGNR